MSAAMAGLMVAAAIGSVLVAAMILWAVRAGSSGGTPGTTADGQRREPRRDARGESRRDAKGAREPTDWRRGLAGLDAAARLERIVAHLQPALEARLEGSCTRAHAGDAAELVGALRGRPLRVRVEPSGALALTLELPTGALDLVLRRGEPAAAPDLGRRDLGKGVHLQAPRDVLPTRIGQWEALAASKSATRFLGAMRAHRIRTARLGGDALALELERPLVAAAVDDPAAELVALVDAVGRLARAVTLHVGREAASEDGAEDGGDDGRGELGEGGPQQRTPLGARLAGFDDLDALEAKDAALRPFFDALSAWVQNPRVVLPTEHEDDAGELRGEVGALRVTVRVSEFGAWGVQCPTRSPLHGVFFHDPAKRPRPPEAEGRDDDPVRVFVAPGVYTEGDEAEVDVALALWASLPPALADRVAAQFPAAPIRHLALASGELGVEAGADLQHLADPVATARALFDVCVELGRALGPGSGRPTRRARCGYCEATYFFGPHRERCPNCGAPASASG